MKYKLPFPNGHSYELEHPTIVTGKGIIDASLKDVSLLMKPIKETDILEIREIIIKEIKRQNDCVARGEEY